MAFIQAKGMDHRSINEAIRQEQECTVAGCMGQRFIASGMKGKKITIEGVPGNALGAYLTGAEITVNGNVQDAVGDTMNEGSIVIHGNAGDALGYAMRGGCIYVKGNAGYRAGIHMKEYGEKRPVMVIGGRVGSFLGEYQAGGVIIVLGIYDDERPMVGNFPCTGMHGGKVYLRGAAENLNFPKNVKTRKADEADLSELKPYVEQYCAYFGCDAEALLKNEYTVVTPDSSNPYKQMYVAN